MIWSFLFYGAFGFVCVAYAHTTSPWERNEGMVILTLKASKKLKAGSINSAGFTLVELIVVIVILATLAVTAAPRFFDFSSAARVATVRAMAGAINAALPMANAQCVLDKACNPNEAVNNTASTRVCLKKSCASGEFVSMHFGYPNASSAGIDRVLLDHEYTVSGSGNQRNFRPKGVATSNNNCRVRYTRAESPGAQPSVEVFNSGC